MSDAGPAKRVIADLAVRRLSAFGESCPLSLGKGGFVAVSEKREGDGKTPLGVFTLLGVMLRPDRIETPNCQLPWRWLRPQDGWGDDPRDPGYNQPVTHPHPFSAERLWREDQAYDVIIVLDHNRAPVVPGAGSAIFWHVAKPDFSPTEGCIAIERDAMLGLLPRLSPGTVLDIRA